MKNKIIILIFSFLFLGNISFSFTLNFDSWNGTGYFVNARGSVIDRGNNIPYDDVTGKMYISGDFGEDNYSDSINYTGIFRAKNFNATTISMSPLYKVKSSGLNSNHEFTMELTRVKFTNGIIDDNGVAEFLESNYYDSGNSVKNSFYNSLKDIDIDSKEKLKSALNQSLGISIFPTFTKQTFDEITSLNVGGIYNIANFNLYSEEGVVNVNGTFNSSKTKVKNTLTNYDYKSNDSSATFWIEKKITPNLKIGTIHSFSQSNTNMTDDKTYRDDYYYSGGIYSVYENNSVLYTTALTLGGDYNHLYRYNDSQVGDFRNASTNKNFFIGLNNLIYKRFTFNNNIYLVPKSELNIIGLHQGEIVEGGKYGMDIHSKNTVSIEPGLGLDLGKDFYKSLHKFTLSSGIMNYYEIANPYDNLEGNFKPFGDSTLKLSKYQNDFYHAKITLKQGYEYSDFLGVSFHEDYTKSKNQYQFEYGFDLTYKF